MRDTDIANERLSSSATWSTVSANPSIARHIMSTIPKRLLQDKTEVKFLRHCAVNMWNGLRMAFRVTLAPAFKGRIDRHSRSWVCNTLFSDCVYWCDLTLTEVTWSVQKPTMAYFNLDCNMMMMMMSPPVYLRPITSADMYTKTSCDVITITEL